VPAAFPTVAATTRSSWLPLALVVALWAALRAAFGAGLSASDPLEYVSIAQRIAEGRFELTTHHYATRFAVTGPLALLIRGFGVSEPVVIAWPLACSLGTLLLLFVIGRRHGGPAVGLIAAATWAVLPLDVIESTNVLPDPILAFFATLAIDSFERGLAAPDDRRARPWLLLAGLAIWAAYSAKIAGALLAPIFAIHAATVGLRGRRLAWVAVGTLSVLLP
jgi:4-amino-4-deoxy-L-arabinose transferase-like glycosyltransferase